MSDIKEVIENTSVTTKEVEANNGKWYQVITMPYIRKTDKSIDGAIITFNDITELKKTQWQLDKTIQNLMRINAELDNFVLSASHDLLAPLSNIEVSINLLNQPAISKVHLDEYLDIIHKSVKKFRLLIQELSTIGKIANESHNIEATDVGELIKDIQLSISDKIASAEAIIETQIQVDKIKLSKKNLRSVLFNLISNAIKDKSDKRIPHVLISTKIEAGLVVLSVEDNGVGISKKEQLKIFNIYHQLQDDIEGQGIGLYLVKRIVENAGAKIEVESEQGVGSTFRIYFKNEMSAPITF